jgi:hypothetical protein
MTGKASQQRQKELSAKERRGLRQGRKVFLCGILCALCVKSDLSQTQLRQADSMNKKKPPAITRRRPSEKQ